MLGVGAQKAGTSWMRWYMQQAPNVDCGPCKEYHVWDALTLPDFPRTQVSPLQAQRSVAAALRFRMQQDPEIYFSYFEERLAQPGITVTADITPLYAALSVETLRRIRDGFAARGVACRVVFLMRDPVARLWSAARMTHRRQGRPLDRQLPDPEAYMHEIARNYGGRVRSRYDGTVLRLEQVFDREEIYLGIYEEMFGAERLAQLSQFLGVPHRPELTAERINADLQAPPVPVALARPVARDYQEVYEFCAWRWPRVVDLWPGFAHLSSASGTQVQM